MDRGIVRNGRATDIDVALTAMTTFQAYVQQADMKVGTLVVVHAGADVAVMTAPATPPGPLALVAFALFALAALASGYHLVQALRPRVREPRTVSRFGITGLPPEAPAGDASEDAWEMARLFAGLAEIKYRHVARAIPWIAAMITIGVGTALAVGLTGS